jgi:hypothetical protein
MFSGQLGQMADDLITHPARVVGVQPMWVTGVISDDRIND